jgi:hypothetical protein
MPSASITKFNSRIRRRRPIVDEMRHALEQLELQSQYPGREPTPTALPQSEYSPWPSANNEEE